MTVDEIKAKLATAEIEIPEGVTLKADLLALLPAELRGEEGEDAGAKKPAVVAPKSVGVGVATRTDKIAATKAKLDAEPKVSFMCPMQEGDRAGAFETVTINGYRMEVPKGEMVELPISVAKMLGNFFKVSLGAGANMAVSRDAKTQEALS